MCNFTLYLGFSHCVYLAPSKASGKRRHLSASSQEIEDELMKDHSKFLVTVLSFSHHSSDMDMDDDSSNTNEDHPIHTSLSKKPRIEPTFVSPIRQHRPFLIEKKGEFSCTFGYHF